MELERKLSSSLVDDIISNSLLEFKPQSTEVCYEVILSTDMGHKLDDKCDYSEPKFTNGDDIIKDGNILRSLSESFMSDVISQGLVSTNVVPAQAKGAGVEDICERTEDTDCTESLPADTVGGVIMDVSSEGGCAVMCSEEEEGGVVTAEDIHDAGASTDSVLPDHVGNGSAGALEDSQHGPSGGGSADIGTSDSTSAGVGASAATEPSDDFIHRGLSQSFVSDVIRHGLLDREQTSPVLGADVDQTQAKGAGVEDSCERTADTDCTESLPADTVGGVIMDVSSEGGCAEVGASQDVLEYHLNECVDGPLEIAHIADIVQLPIGEDDNKTDQLATDTEIFLSHNDPLVQSSHNSVVDMSLYVLQSDYHSLEEMLAHENEKTNRLTVELNSLQNELNMLRRNHLKGCEEMSNQISDSNQRNVMKDVEIASLNATVATLMAQMAESQRLWEAERNKMECERQATDALMLEINEQNKAFQISSNEKNALNSALLKEVVSAEEKLKCTIEKYEVS